MLAKDFIVDKMMVEVKNTICGNMITALTFSFFDAAGLTLTTLDITDLQQAEGLVDTYNFIGETGTQTVIGEIILTGTASYFSIFDNVYGNECFRGSVGEISDINADIKFNDREWTVDDIITLTNLSLKIDKGSFTAIA
jgi:hypothetical protein